MSGPELGGNRDTHDESDTLDAITTVNNDAVDVFPENPSRMRVLISFTERAGIVRLMDAATDPSVRKGTYKPIGSTFELEGAMYTGPISVINAKNNQHPTFYPVEY